MTCPLGVSTLRLMADKTAAVEQRIRDAKTDHASDAAVSIAQANGRVAAAAFAAFYLELLPHLDAIREARARFDDPARTIAVADGTTLQRIGLLDLVAAVDEMLATVRP